MRSLPLRIRRRLGAGLSLVGLRATKGLVHGPVFFPQRLCLVLHIPQPFLNNPDHFGGMRLGFGAAELKAAPKSSTNFENARAHCVVLRPDVAVVITGRGAQKAAGEDFVPHR